MRTSLSILQRLNHLFPLPAHPFNLETAGTMTYAQWQYEQGHRTLEYFQPFCSAVSMFSQNRVLDIGCGSGGKTCYYATLGAQHVTGIDHIPHYAEEARQFSHSLGLAEQTNFLTADAGRLPFASDQFDTIIANDVMEHFEDPSQVLAECHRVLVSGGRLFINFPPYYHPYGAHLSDAIGIPWVHLMFDTNTLAQAYLQAIQQLPDAERRMELKLGADSDERATIPYVNRMTTGRFRAIIAEAPFDQLYYREVPLRPFLFPLAKIPGIKEAFLRMIVTVLRK